MTNFAVTSATISTGVSGASSLLLRQSTSAVAIAFASHYGASGSSSSSPIDLVMALRGGARVTGKKNNAVAPAAVSEEPKSMMMTPQAKSVLWMAIGMSLHYLAYSLARPSTLALFTSGTVGFASSPGAFPLAMALVSPTSLVLLAYYTYCLSSAGPHAALRRTTGLCSLFLTLCPILIQTLDGGDYANYIRWIVGAVFVFREAYVQLLTSQYWSFMSSVLTPTQSSKWFAPISGLTSITSALAGWGMGPLVDQIGLNGVLMSAGLLLSTSLLFVGKAYNLSDKYGFNPANELIQKHEKKLESKQQRQKSAGGKKNNANVVVVEEEEDSSMIQKASKLFSRVPVLKSLFFEILACQGLSTLLNVCFVTKLSQAMPDDTKRAGWMGKFFATINIISCALQFGILPPLMSVVEPSAVWRIMPLFMLALISYQSIFEVDPSLLLVSGSFMAMKTMEFSVRRMLDELVYVPLDFDSRYLGKEIIGVFGYRFGKSGMSLALSGLTSMFGNFGLAELSYLSTGAAFLWLTTAWQLSNKVLTRSEAEQAYKQVKGL